jgi:Flp pilus assembly protein TadG
MSRPTPLVRSRVRRFAERVLTLARDRRGVSAVEFALLLPLMVALYLGGTEISQAISISRKVTLTARTVADLVSRVTSTSTSDLQNSLNAAVAVMAPYQPALMTVTISQIYIDSQGRATIDWSCSYQGTARQAQSPVTLPNSVVNPSSYLVWGESQYNFTPQIGYVITGTLQLKDQIYMVPRMSSAVTFKPANCPTFS